MSGSFEKIMVQKKRRRRHESSNLKVLKHLVLQVPLHNTHFLSPKMAFPNATFAINGMEL